jgi:hypothetical protein
MRHLFEFTLDPVEQICPWGEPPDLSLHWFGLSLGSYWIDLGTTRLLEYLPLPGWPVHVDYQLARFHEDVLDILPEILEPVPSDVIVRFPEGSIIGADQHLLRRWETFDEAPDDLDLAREKLGARYLDTGYLSPSACIWFWSDADNVIVEWDNRDRLNDGKPVCGLHPVCWRVTRGC